MVVQTGRTIKGLVTDANGEPLIGCNVVVVGSNAGVITDIDGRFTLNIPADAKQIKVSYIGYVDQIINLHDRSDFKVVLKEDNNALDEVVVVGYGTQKKATLTGAVEQIGSQVLESRAVTVPTSASNTAPDVGAFVSPLTSSSVGVAFSSMLFT